MTLDEAIRHCEEVAEQKERDSVELIDILDEQDVTACKECAADHRQLAEWLKGYKELEAKHWDECRQIAHYDDELKEAKRLLKAAVEDITFILSYSCSDEEMCCKECPTVNHACNKWRYADEALKLLGGNENG